MAWTHFIPLFTQLISSLFSKKPKAPEPPAQRPKDLQVAEPEAAITGEDTETKKKRGRQSLIVDRTRPQSNSSDVGL